MTSLDPITGTRWTIQPVPFGMAVLVSAIGLHLIWTLPSIPAGSASVAAGGAIVSGLTVWMLTMGWVTDDRLWTQRGYFFAASVFLGRGVAVAMTGGAWIDVAFMGGLFLTALLCCRAEVEARWLRSQGR